MLSSELTCTSCGRALTEPTQLTVCSNCLKSTDRVARHPTDAKTNPILSPRLSEILQGGVVDYLGRNGYWVERKVGAGGYGTVYRARDAANRTVAVKVLHSYLTSEPVLARFQSEATALGALDHPGLVRLHHYHPDPESPFLVTEFVPGGTLGARLKADGPYSPDAAADLVEQVARVVQYLHENQVFHRDLKPSNILLDADGRPRVADFGLAKRITSGEPLTRFGYSIGGTPEYGSPEQFCLGKPTDCRSDVYSLGAVMYALLTGRPPYLREAGDENGYNVVQQVLKGRPASPRTVNPDVPEPLAAVCLRAMERNPEDRFPSAAVFADEVARARAGLKPVTPPTPWTTRVLRRVRQSPKQAIAVVVLAVAIVALISAAIPPRSKPVDEPAAIALKAGQPFDLIPEFGMPTRTEWLVGDAGLPDQADEGNPFQYTSFQPAYLSLCRDPGVDSFRITAELRMIDCRAQANSEKDTHSGIVGVFWGYRGNKMNDGMTVAGAPAICFTEYQLNPGGPFITHSMKRVNMGYGAAPLKDGGLLQQEFESVPLDPVPILPGPWRTITVDVKPQELTCYLAGETKIVPPNAFRDDMRKFDALLTEWARRDIRFPTYNTRRPLGIFTNGAKVAVKRFTLSPIPAD